MVVFVVLSAQFGICFFILVSLPAVGHELVYCTLEPLYEAYRKWYVKDVDPSIQVVCTTVSSYHSDLQHTPPVLSKYQPLETSFSSLHGWSP